MELLPPLMQQRILSTVCCIQITLPTFTGNPLDWLTFWDSCQAAIHLNPNLSDVQKFNYLKAQLDRDAAKTIDWFSLSDHTYLPFSMNILVKHKLVAAHKQALLEVASLSNTLNSLFNFHYTINSHSHGLYSPLERQRTPMVIYWYLLF